MRKNPMPLGFVPAAALALAAGLTMCAADALGDTCQVRHDRALDIATQHQRGEPFPDVLDQARDLRERVLVSRLFTQHRYTSTEARQRAAEREAARVLGLCQRVALQRASAP
jgi:hypothetical protein